MEGDGMVAIVQGLKDAGLAVTLMNKTLLKNTLKPNTVPISKSSVETSTNVERIGRNTAAQVRDDHYTSSYQLAHCNIRPSSPPERLPEFPPQRLEPSRNEGSFQVGGYGSGEFYSPVPSYYGSQGYRGGIVWPDRDPFVHSLRRYPLSPERSVSSELVQRLLNYTQNKHSSKNSNVRNISLRDEGPSRDQNTDATTTKNIQTYTRSKNEPTRDCGANTNNDIKFSYGKKARNFASTSPYNVKSKNDRHNDTYDYLKASTRRGRHPEVRYLNDVRKCIRDTIKQMYEDKPLVCPQIKSRYSQHKREHHQNSSENSFLDAQCGERQASTSTPCEAPMFARCQPPTETQSICPKQLCCCCKKPIPSNQEFTLPDVPPEPHEDKEVAEAKIGVCTCKDAPKSGNKIADDIFKWLKTLPVYADDSLENKTKREEMIQDLADKLKSLEGDRHYEHKAKEEIMKCIEKLPMWYPGAKREQEMFKNQIANDLISRLTDIEIIDKIKDVIDKWIDGIQFENDENVDKDDIAENLVYRLKPLVDKTEEMKSEIKDTLQRLPIVNKNRVINKLTDKLTNDLTVVTKETKKHGTDSIDELEDQIIDWFEDTPELCSDINENKMTVKSLAKKLKNIQKLNLDFEGTQEQMKDEVVNWIDSVLKSKGEKLDSKTKAKLSNKLLDKLMSAAELESKNQMRKSSLGEQYDYVQEFSEWLDGVVDISEEDKTNNRKLVNSFARKLQELISGNADNEVVKKEIIDFLGTLSKQGVAVSSKNREKLANNLINKIMSEPSVSLDEDLQQSILIEISELVEDIPSHISEKTRKVIKNKVADILAKNFNNLSDKTDNINHEIVNILKKEAKMPDSDAFELASALINRIKGMPDQSTSSFSRSFSKTDSKINDLVSEEVSDVLNNYTINTKNRKEVEKGITQVLADQIVRGTDKNTAKDNIISILYDADVAEGDALDITNRLLDRSRELSLSYKTQDSKIVISKSRLSRHQSNPISPLEREEFEEKAEREILDFIEDLTGDDSPKTRKKRKEAAEKLAHGLSEILSDPNKTDKEKSIIEEVSQYLRKFSVDSDIPIEEMAKTLSKRLQDIGFQASTPKKHEYSFHPKRDSIDISSIHVDMTYDDPSKTFKKPVLVITNEEKQYVNELTEIIQTWMDELPIDLSVTEDKGFKETMIQDLASDIIDRQKYLQLNPDTKTSNQEEVEHLKYQVFRWLNKLLDTGDLSLVMQNTETLMRKIKDVDVPELVEPIGKHKESKSAKELVQSSMDSIRDEISSWMDEIPRNLYTSTDINFQKRMVNELAEKIQQFRVNNQTEYIDSEISNWLSKLMKDSHKQELIKMAEALKARLKERGFTEASFMLSQDSSQFIEENLIGGIQEWLINVPLYQKRNSTQKREITSLLPELVKGLKSVFTSTQDSVIDSDKRFIDEIVKHLKKFPMEVEQKSDPAFLQKTAVQLLQYLKDLQMFANISDRLDGPPDEYLTMSLNDWINSLPISNMNSTETIQFKILKKEFVEKVKQIQQEKPENKQGLKNEIRSYLMKFPMEKEMKTNHKFINDKIEQLLNNLLPIPVKTVLEHGSDEFVKKAVTNWMKLLPLEKEKTVDDIPANAIDELGTAISNLLIKTDIIQIDNIKKTLENETEKFLKSVPLEPSVNIDVKDLAQELFKEVKEMSRKGSSAAKALPTKKAADILFDNIESWCENLPLKEDTPKEIEKAKKVKQEISSKLVHKIGELNMNPEIFNDNFLYDDMLEDEIDNLLADLSSEDVKNNYPAIKKDLMEKVKEARQKVQEEVAGQAYKQQLREAISKTLPSQPLTVEEQVTFEVLKDNLADAFISLHYVGGDEGQKNKYKAKINDEVNKFCNDYLKKHPASPINSKKLNQDLYNALKGVPIPKDETVRNEVELVKIEDEVNDWVKELPLKEQTAAQQMQTNKMVAVLAKKIHDIEKVKELKPDADCDDKMRKEITKWIKKLPVKIDDAEVTSLTNRLVNNLKSTEKTRRISALTRHSIGPHTLDVTPLTDLPNACKPTCTGTCKSQYAVPPSTLSFEDREHLQRIRERSPAPRLRYPPSKDASVSPLQIDAGSQTEIRPWETCQPTCGKRLVKQNSGIQTQRPPEQKTMQAVGSQAEVSPHVIVREYYWDPLNASKMACTPCPSQITSPTRFPQSPSMTPQMPDIRVPVSQQPSPYSQGPCSRCPHLSPQSSVPGPYDSQTPTPQPKVPRKEWEQPCYRREMPGDPSEHPEPGTSRSFRTPKARVTRLGSFDEMNPKSSRSRHEWSKFPEEDEFWGGKPRFASDEDEEPFLKEQKKEEEKVRCRCRERIVTKCVGRKRGRGCHSTGQSTEDMKRCSRCCGVHCPYPSYLYFRQ